MRIHAALLTPLLLLLLFIFFIFFISASLASEDEPGMTDVPISDRSVSIIRQTIVTPKESWCVAQKTIDDSTLQAALDYACGQTTADCTAILLDGPCFLPNTIVHHASYVFNSYYQMNAKGANTCSFGGAATVTTVDPSTETCQFPSSGSLNQSTRVVENEAMKIPSQAVYVFFLGSLLTYTLF